MGVASASLTLIKRAKRLLDKRWQLAVIMGVIMAAFMFCLFLLFRFIVIPLVVRQMIIQQSTLVEGSRMMEKWKNPKYKMQFKVWVYSVKNPDEILGGAVPQLSPSGPYVFDKTIRHEVSEAGNGTVTFKRKVLYHFNENDSCQTCILGNRVWVPNIIYQKFVEVASRPEMRAAAATLIAQTPFLELEVGDLLFRGYKDPFLENFCDLPVANIVCSTIFEMPERIGLFFGFNDTYVEGEYTIKDGTNDINERADVIAFNGMPVLRKEWWDEEKAREIRGSEGTLFHPFIDKGEALWTYASQLCRSIKLLFVGETTYEDVPLYRFQVPPEEFDTSSPDQTGFCHPNEKLMFSHQKESSNTKHCYPRGILSVARCRPNEPPVVISLPNFNYATDEVRQSVNGLNETDDSRDAILVDVHPDLGIAFRALRHIQLNVEFWAGKDIVLPVHHQRQRSTLIPIAIVHDDAEIDADSLAMVKNELILARKLAYGSTTLLLLSALSVLSLSALYGLYRAGVFQACCPRKVYVENPESAASSTTELYDDPLASMRPKVKITEGSTVKRPGWSELGSSESDNQIRPSNYI